MEDLNIDYCHKDLAKKYGARWNSDERTWQIESHKADLFKKILLIEKTLKEHNRLQLKFGYKDEDHNIGKTRANLQDNLKRLVDQYYDEVNLDSKAKDKYKTNILLRPKK